MDLKTKIRAKLAEWEDDARELREPFADDADLVAAEEIEFHVRELSTLLDEDDRGRA